MNRSVDRIDRRSPITLEYYRSIAPNKNAMDAYYRFRLNPTINAKNASRDIASRVIRALELCPKFVGRGYHSGSVVRDVSLKRPLWSDVDVVCFLHKNQQNDFISSFNEFQKVRFPASKFIMNFLGEEIGKHFAPGGGEATVEVDKSKIGFVIKLVVKRNTISIRPWYVDILFAFDLEMNNNVPQWPLVMNELHAMKGSEKFLQTSSMAPFRDAFYSGLYSRTPRLKVVVKHLKCFNRIFGGAERESTVNSFFFESLALLLFDNGYIPSNFSVPRALATCHAAIADPSKVPALFFAQQGGGGDALARPVPPTKDQLVGMKKRAGPKCLVLIDPFAPFNNLAIQKANQQGAWDDLPFGAKSMVELLKSQNVTPYAF